MFAYLLESLFTSETGISFSGFTSSPFNRAIGAMAGLKRLGIRVPEDVKVFGFDNQLQSCICTPSLSTIERDPVSLGTASAELLLSLIRNKKDTRPSGTILNCRLIERHSTAL